MNIDHMDAWTHYLTSVEWAPSLPRFSLVEPSQGRITLGNSGVSELAIDKREGCHKTVQIFTFSYLTVQYSHHPSLAKERGRELKARSQWDSYGTKERVATKQYKYSPSLIQQSSWAIIQAWQKRGQTHKLRDQWDSYGIKERVATKQNKYSPCVNSPVHSNFMGNLCRIFYLVPLQELGVLVCWLYSMCKWEKKAIKARERESMN